MVSLCLFIYRIVRSINDRFFHFVLLMVGCLNFYTGKKKRYFRNNKSNTVKSHP